MCTLCSSQPAILATRLEAATAIKMTSQCCSSGTLWTIDHTPLGNEEVLYDLSVYVIGPESAKNALLYIHDAFGWKLPNARFLADRFSQATGARVYLPDLYVFLLPC